MFYLHEEKVYPVDLVFKLIRKWKFPKDDLKIIKDDWNFIHSKSYMDKRMSYRKAIHSILQHA